MDELTVQGAVLGFLESKLFCIEEEHQDLLDRSGEYMRLQPDEQQEMDDRIDNLQVAMHFLKEWIAEVKMWPKA